MRNSKSEMKTILRQAEQDGWRLKRRGTKVILSHPDGGLCIVHLSGDGGRTLANTRAMLKRERHADHLR
jgi:predicted RNA binding protein YcfA (HicA-like mRNA interferase family)